MNPALAPGLCLVLLLTPSGSVSQQTAEIRGRVLDASGGEPLARVEIQLEGGPDRTVTDAAGRFNLAGLAPGDYTLRVSTVGYRQVRKELSLSPGEVEEFEIVLSPDTLRRSDSVDVRADPFEPLQPDRPEALSLSGTELKNLSTVLADDPLRAVQSLPGVASNDDFSSHFSLRGADYHRVGLYWDSVLLHSPFFTVQGASNTGSITALNGDALAGVELQNGAFPVRYADSSAGALDLTSRDGSRVRPTSRFTASAASASALAEGPLDRRRHGDWLVAVRKSYVQYLVKRVSDDPSLAFGFADAETKVSYDPSAKHHVSLSAVEGASNLDRTHFRNQLGLFSIMTADYRIGLANLAWRYTPSGHLLLTQRGAFLEESYQNRNRDKLPLRGGHYGEWVYNCEGTWLWSGQNAFDFGWSLRRIRNDSFLNIPVVAGQNGGPAATRVDTAQGHGLRLGGFAEQSWKPSGGRFTATAGLRWDRHSVDRIQAVLPRVSVSFLPRRSTRFDLSWGQYVQYPDLVLFFSKLGSASLLPERATQFVAGIEQRLDERTRVRIEFYDRQDRDLLLAAFYQPAIKGVLDPYPPSLEPVRNSVHGYARGVDVFVQRRSANRLSGWISYAYGSARLHGDESATPFPADLDQRHTANAYLSYRLRPTLSLSVKALYGSGFPLPGFYQRAAGAYFLSDTRNAVRLPAYERTDSRINKDFTFDRCKLTLFGEVVNLLNRTNKRFDSFNGFNPATRQAYLTFSNLIPILPSAGIAVEF